MTTDLFVGQYPDVTVLCPECGNACHPSADDSHWVCPVCDEAIRLLPPAAEPATAPAGPSCGHCQEPICDEPSVVCPDCDDIFHAACYPLPSYHQPRRRGVRRARS